MLVLTSFFPFIIFFNVIFFKFNYLFLSHLNGSSNVLSVLNRMYTNNFYFNNFYFLWTSLWYIPIYIFILLVFLYSNSSFIHLKKRTFVIIFSVVMYILYLSYFNCNLIQLGVTIFPENVNFLLLNSVNKIHPLLLYVSLLIFIIVLLNFYNYNVNFIQKNEIIMFNNILIIKNKILISIYTLYLGSWWALQEGSWGGWWNWDFSEVFGLFILYKLLLVIHNKFNLRSISTNRVYFIFSFILLLLFYLSIQLNFSYVSHNFGFRFYKFISTTVLFNYLLLLTLIFFVNFQNEFYVSLMHISIKRQIRNSRLISLLLFLSTLVLYLSIFILFNDFLWNNFNLNLLNFQYDFNNLVFILVYTLIIFFFDLKLIVFFFLFFNRKILIDFFLLKLKKVQLLNFIIIVHYTFVIVFLYTLCYHKEILSNLKIIPNNYYGVINFEVTSNLLSVENNSNTIGKSTTFDNKYFVLNLINNILIQDFYPLGYKELIRLSVIDNLIIFIYTNFVFSFCVLVYQINKVIRLR